MLSLTATATRETKQAILDVLGMKDPYKIEESPQKPNISYVVEYMQPDKSLCHQFQWLVEEINKNGLSTERTIIYCQTIQQCSHMYSMLKSMIGDTIYAVCIQGVFQPPSKFYLALDDRAIKVSLFIWRPLIRSDCK